MKNMELLTEKELMEVEAGNWWKWNKMSACVIGIGVTGSVLSAAAGPAGFIAGSAASVKGADAACRALGDKKGW
jgi:hypothetical protein